MKTGEKRALRGKDVDGRPRFQINDSETQVPRRMCEITEKMVVTRDRLKVKNGLNGKRVLGVNKTVTR